MIEVKRGEKITLSIRDESHGLDVTASGEVVGLAHASEEFDDGSRTELVSIRFLTQSPTKSTIEERLTAIEQWIANQDDPSPIGG